MSDTNGKISNLFPGASPPVPQASAHVCVTGGQSPSGQRHAKLHLVVIGPEGPQIAGELEITFQTAEGARVLQAALGRLIGTLPPDIIRP